MRSEGFGKHDISLFVEERVEFIHSRIQLQPLLTSIDYGRKASNEFSLKVNSSLGKILSMRLNRMATQMDKKLRQLHNPRTRSTERNKRALEFVGNLISQLFGNPGPEDWKQNTRNIVAMKAAIERQIKIDMLLTNKMKF